MPRRTPPLATLLEEHPKRNFFLSSIALLLLLYWRSFSSPFLYDDLDQVVNNRHLTYWSGFVHRFLLHPVSMSTSFLGVAGSSYRPLFWISLFVDRSVWGLHPAGFHATNLILHLLNANLAFALLRRLKVSALTSAAAGLLWLSLPVNTEAVAWISGRAYLLCMFFLLLSLLAALQYLERQRTPWLAATGLAAACAMLSHELGLITVLLVPAVAFAAQHTTPASPHKASSVIPRLLTAAALAACAVEAARFAGGVRSFSGIAGPLWAWLAFWQYIRLALAPVHMSVERSTTLAQARSSLQPHAALWMAVALLAVALLAALAWRLRRQSPAVPGGLLWFVLCIAPFCVLVNYQGIAERFEYVASLGIVIGIVAACSAAGKAWPRNAAVLAVAAWGAWNAGRTAVRVGDWTDPVRLYSSSLVATPRSPSLHYNLGFSLRERGDLTGAAQEYGRAVALDRTYPNALASLGDVYLAQRSYAQAQAAYQQALAQNPHDIAVLLNSGAAFQGAGERDKAEAAYRRVLQADANNSAAHVNLGVLYLSEHRPHDATHEFAAAIDLRTTDITPYYDMGVLFQQEGRPDLALSLYKKVLELKPGDEDTLRNLRLLQQGR